MKIQNIGITIGTALAAIGMAVAAVPAEAGTGTIRGYRATVVDSGRWDTSDSLSVFGPAGLEVISVTCSPFDWKSHGPNAATWANSIAESWCFNGGN